MIDQGAMLLGPALAGAIIGWNAAWGAGFIALWNVILWSPCKDSLNAFNH